VLRRSKLSPLTDAVQSPREFHMPQLGTAPRNRWRVTPGHADLVRPPVPPRPVRFPAHAQALTIDLARTAIVVIDMQNDFCTRGGWLDHIGVDVTATHRAIAPLNALLPVLRGAGAIVVWVNWGNRPDRLNLSPALEHVYKPTGEGVGLGDPMPATGAKVLEKSSWGAAIIDALVPHADDVHVDKFRMSGFWDTPLDSIFRNTGVATLLFAGVNADQCVLATLMDANFLGYDTILLEDCCATTSPSYCWDATLYNVRQCFGFTALGSDIANHLA
jgi:nicotinamidase-related amidase